MATVNLGAIKFNWKGAYNSGTAYVIDDVVSSGGNSYICVASSIGNAVSDTAYWAVMAQAGTNGTDLTSTLTTQGDVLYRDGSGLQRLAKGTSSQTLAMNSGATAPEWVDPAGGAWAVKSSGTVSSVSELIVSSLTKHTKIYVTDITTSASTTFYIRCSKDAGSTFDATNGNYTYDKWAMITGSSTLSDSTATNQNAGYIQSSTENVSAADAYLELEIHNPADTAKHTMISFRTASNRSYNNRQEWGVVEYNFTNAMNAIKIYPSSGTFSATYVAVELN